MSASLLAQAIRERRVVAFSYHGEGRLVEPYQLGEVAGRLTLRGWQSRKGWRSFLVREMVAIQATDRYFDEPRDGYAPDQRMRRVQAAL